MAVLEDVVTARSAADAFISASTAGIHPAITAALDRANQGPARSMFVTVAAPRPRRWAPASITAGTPIGGRLVEWPLQDGTGLFRVDERAPEMSH